MWAGVAQVGAVEVGGGNVWVQGTAALGPTLYHLRENPVGARGAYEGEIGQG